MGLDVIMWGGGRHYYVNLLCAEKVFAFSLPKANSALFAHFQAPITAAALLRPFRFLYLKSIVVVVVRKPNILMLFQTGRYGRNGRSCSLNATGSMVVSS